MHENSQESKINGHRFNNSSKFSNVFISKDGKACFPQLSFRFLIVLKTPAKSNTYNFVGKMSGQDARGKTSDITGNYCRCVSVYRT